MPFGRAVEEKGGAHVTEKFRGQAADRVQREMLRCRQSDRERDDIPALGESENVCDHRVVRTGDTIAEKLTPRNSDPSRRRVGRSQNGCATAHMGIHQPKGLEPAVGVEDRRAVDAECLSQSSFGR